MSREAVEYLAKALGATVEIARAFPADKYDFWAAPQSMPVGEQIGHLAINNEYFIAPVAEMLRDTPPPDNSALDPIVRLERSVSRMTDVLIRVPDDAWNRPLVYPDGYQMTPSRVVLTALEHDAHHRGQLVVALRLLEIDPPKRWRDG